MSKRTPSYNDLERWPKQFGDFAEQLTMFVMGRLNNMSVALIDHVGADVIAIPIDKGKGKVLKPLAVSVKGRIFPPDESKMYPFDKNNIAKLRNTASSFNMEPAISFVFIPVIENKENDNKVNNKPEQTIHIIIAKLDDLYKMAEDDNYKFVNKNEKDKEALNISLAYYSNSLIPDIVKAHENHLLHYMEMRFEGDIPSANQKDNKGCTLSFINKN